MVGNPNIANEAKKAGVQFKKGQSGNLKGRPKKGIGLVNERLREEGYPPASKQDIEENYMQLVQLPESILKKIIADKKEPILVRVISKNVLSGKGFDVIEKMLDRGIGKAMQRSEVTTTETPYIPNEEDLIDD